MVLQDSDPIPTVLPVEVGAQAIPRVGEPPESREGAGSLLRRLREAHIVYLGLVYYLDDRKTTPVYFGLITVHSVVVCHHVPRGEIK